MSDLKNGSSLEQHLIAIQSQLNQQAWTLKDFFRIMKKKGYSFLIIILALPFCQPIQIPGFSVPFGIVLMIIGLRMAIGRRIWWPEWILKKNIPSDLLTKVIDKSLSFIRFLNHFTSHRLTWLTDASWDRMHGFFITLMGFCLALPLPIPLSNLPSAWALFFLALGLLEDDGLFVIFAYLIGIIFIIGLGLLIFLFKQWIT